jgi:hypothetical protein
MWRIDFEILKNLHVLNLLIKKNII